MIARFLAFLRPRQPRVPAIRIIAVLTPNQRAIAHRFEG